MSDVKTYNKVTKTEYKTKDYVRRALNNYHKKRVEKDPEYENKLKEDRKKYREKNKDKIKEKMKIYMREYRAKKKEEKLASSKQTGEVAIEKDQKDNKVEPKVDNNIE
jgi:hypothetical protein